MTPPRYVLIAGHGRSGTNWLLEILDQSQQTHCRNEPNECAGSALRAAVGSDRPPRTGWGTGTRVGCGHRTNLHLVREPRPEHQRVQEPFLPGSSRNGPGGALRGKKLRKILSPIMSSLRCEEWPVPSWVVNKRQNDRSLPILKINMEPGWIVWVLRNRPEARVLHIVRHPGGFLNSLMKRLWSELDMETVVRDNRERLARIAATDPVWACRFRDVDTLSPVETELWYWRYSSETIHQAGEGSPHYQLVKYEELTGNPQEVSRAVYRGCGLAWNDTIEQAIHQKSGESQSIAAAWETKLASEAIAAVKRILGDCAMRDWWDGSGRIGPAPGAGIFDGTHHAGLATGREAFP